MISQVGKSIITGVLMVEVIPSSPNQPNRCRKDGFLTSNAINVHVDYKMLGEILVKKKRKKLIRNLSSIKKENTCSAN